MKASFKIPRNVLAAMCGFQSQDGSRRLLMGTHFECGSNRDVTLIATNGRIIGVYRHECGAAASEPVSFTADAAPALKLFAGKAEMFTVELSDDSQEVRFSVASKQTVSPVVVAVKNITAGQGFPAWRSVLPDGAITPASEYMFNPELMAPFVAAAKLLARDRACVRIVHHADDQHRQPVAYSVFIGDQNFYGCLMPMRGYDNPSGPPDWAKPIPAPVPAPALPAESILTPATPSPAP